MTTVVAMPTVSSPELKSEGPRPEAARTLKVKAHFALSEPGRKAALLLGRSGREHQRLRIEVPSHRLHLVQVDADGTARLKLRPRYEARADGRVIRIDALPVYDHVPSADELLLAAAKNYELEQSWRAQRSADTERRATALGRRDQIAQAFLSDRAQRALEHPTPTPAWCYLPTTEGRMLFDATKGSALSRKVPAEAHRRFQADLRARRWANKQKRAAQERLHEEKLRFVAEWISAHGTADQRARQQAGILPFEEAIEAIADHVFAPARDYSLYPHDGAAWLQARLRTLPQYADTVVTNADLAHSFGDGKDGTATQWARVHQLQAALPAASVTLRFHRLSSRKEPRAPAFMRYGVLAVQQLGPLTLRREYEAGD